MIGVVHQKQRARPKLHEDTYNNRDALIRTKRSRDKAIKKNKKKNQNENKFIPIIIYVASAGDGLVYGTVFVVCGGGDMDGPKIITKYVDST